MKFADWLRGVESVVLASVVNVFNDARAAVALAPLPQNLKYDVVKTLNDAQDDLTSVGGLAGTLVGNMAADAVDDLTTLLMNTAGALASAEQPSDFSAAEKTVLAQTWTAMRAQGDTLMAQFMAGVNPAAPAPAKPAPAVSATTTAFQKPVDPNLG